MQTAIVKLLTADAVKNYLKVTTVQIEDFELTTIRFNVWDKKLKRSLLPLIKPLINNFVSILNKTTILNKTKNIDIYYFYF